MYTSKSFSRRTAGNVFVRVTFASRKLYLNSFSSFSISLTIPSDTVFAIILRFRWFMGFDWEALRARAMEAPIVPKVTNPSDSRNFDNYSEDLDEAPEELSGWDQGF